MFDIFNFSSERLLAKGLSVELAKQLPPKLFEQEKRGNLSVNQVSRALERVYAVAAGKNQQKKMGVLRRSILANGFKWHLKEVGYPDDFIDMAVEGLLVELIKKK